MKVSLTVDEIEALTFASGNIDPCMFDEMDEGGGDRLFAAWISGRQKLGEALGIINSRKIIARHKGTIT